MCSKHAGVCVKNNPSCPCLTCHRDDGYAECCTYRYPRTCGSTQQCSGYRKEVTFHAEE